MLENKILYHFNQFFIQNFILNLDDDSRYFFDDPRYFMTFQGIFVIPRGITKKIPCNVIRYLGQ